MCCPVLLFIGVKYTEGFLIVPIDYHELLGYYTQRGFRVIACATKNIAKLSWLKTQKMSRSEAESDLEFVGFFIFENKLKPSTAGVIHELNDAGIRNVMCTGDNILTAISVARECSLIDRTGHCFVPRFLTGGLLNGSLLWYLLTALQVIREHHMLV